MSLEENKPIRKACLVLDTSSHGFDPLSQSLTHSRGLLDELNQQRITHAKPIPKKAEEAHQEVLVKIKEFFADDSIERKVLHNPFIPGVGCIARLSDGRYHIIIHDEVVKFLGNNATFESFKNKNPDKPVTPRDLFMNTVAHEYGHILLSERIEPRLRYIGYSQRDTSFTSLEVDEAFAFFLGDHLTGLSSPLEELSSGYKQRGVDFEKTISIYHELMQLVGIKGTFDVETIRQFISKYQPKQDHSYRTYIFQVDSPSRTLDL